jgi:type II secretory pathway pseudopilin PulG
MKRCNAPTLPRQRAESDLTVMVLVGLVILLMLIVGGVAGLGVMQWKRAEQAQRMAEQALLEAREQEAMARHQAKQSQAALQQRLVERDHPLLQQSTRAGGMVGATAGNPWQVVALLNTDGQAK